MAGLTWIDTHCHVSAWGGDGLHRAKLLADLLAVLDGEDQDLRMVISLDVGVELTRMMREPEGILEGNRLIHQLCHHAPGRLYGSCVVNPHFLEASLEAMDVCFGEWGFVQLGEMLQYIMHYEMADEAVATIARHAAAYGVPVQVHISTSNSCRDLSCNGVMHLQDLFALIDRVPEARYVLAHVIGTMADDPPVIEHYLNLIDEHFGRLPESIWLEIRDFNSPGVPAALRRVPASHLLAGTDWVSRVGPPFLPYGMVFANTTVEGNPYPPCVESMAGFLRAAGASEQEVARIAHGNARELLGIE